MRLRSDDSPVSGEAAPRSQAGLASAKGGHPEPSVNILPTQEFRGGSGRVTPMGRSLGSEEDLTGWCGGILGEGRGMDGGHQGRGSAAPSG